MGEALARLLIDPRYRRAHLLVIVVALVVHLSLHYATYVPALREPLAGLPYFRLHVLHEAEFLLIVAYAGIVLGLFAGMIAIATTAITSTPFILTPYIFGRDPRPGEIRDLAIQVGFILLMGFLMVLLYDRDQRRKSAESNNTALREMDQLRNNFMSMAAHELRTPMTTVMGFSDLLVSRDVTADQRVQWASTIGGETRRLNDLIEELLSMSRLAAGKLEVEVGPVALDEVASVALGSVGSPNGHVMAVDIASDLPRIAADRDKLIQILVNLLSNAIKYSPDGGEVRLVGRVLNDGRICIDMTDQGRGISPEDQAKLFTSFHRVDRPETENIQGTGLGLSIVKSLTELMGGTVAVESGLDVGSTFSVTLPVWRERLVAEAA